MNKNPFDEFPLIKTEDITLRKIVPSDLDSLFEIYSNEKLFLQSPYMLKKNKDTVANMIGHFVRDFNKKKDIKLGICQNSEPDGVAGVFEIFDYSRACNMVTIGYRLNDKYWGRGLATKAVAAVCDYLFDEIGISRIQAFVMPANTKSLAVLERNNFVNEGTIRQGYVWKGHGVVDLTVFSMLKTDRRD